MAYLLRVVAALALALAGFPALATVYNTGDQGEAQAACAAMMPNAETYEVSNGTELVPAFHSFAPTAACDTILGQGSATPYYMCGFFGKSVTTGAVINTMRACSTKGSGHDRFYYPAANTCNARNADLGGGERAYGGTPPRCVAGCKMEHGATISTTVNGVTLTTTENTEYSGEACNLLPGDTPLAFEPGPTSPDTEKACTPAGNGQSACVKPNGDYCATASSGKEFCWAPTATGEQVDGNNLQRRTPGATRPTDPPTTPPPEGEEWNTNDSHSSTSNQNGSYTVTNASTTPGDTGHTQPGADSSGEDEEGDPGTVSGGGDCTAEPTCSGTFQGVAVQCAQVKQTWKARCAAEITGDPTNCDSDAPLVCTNMSAADCILHAQAKKTACAVSGEAVDTEGMGDADDFGDAGVTASDAWRPGVGQPGGPEEAEPFDDSGWLSSRSCPQLPTVDVFGTTLDFNAHAEKFCWFLGLGSQLVLLFAALASIRIVSRVI